MHYKTVNDKITVLREKIMCVVGAAFGSPFLLPESLFFLRSCVHSTEQSVRVSL